MTTAKAVALAVVSLIAIVLLTSQVGRVSPVGRSYYFQGGPPVRVVEGGTAARDTSAARRNLGVPGKYQAETIYGAWDFQDATFSGAAAFDDDAFYVRDPADNTRRVRIDAGGVAADSTYVLHVVPYSGSTGSGTLPVLEGTNSWTGSNTFANQVLLDDPGSAYVVQLVGAWAITGNRAATFPNASGTVAFAESVATTYVGVNSTNWGDLTDAGATTLHKHDHGGQDGLTDDDHTQYAKLAGRSGGQSLIGGTSDAEYLLLQATATGAASPGQINMNGGAGTGTFGWVLSSVTGSKTMKLMDLSGTMPVLVDTLYRNGMVADLTAETIATGAGFFDIGAYGCVTTGGSGTLFLKVTFTDDSGAQTRSITTLTLSTAGNAGHGSALIHNLSGNVQVTTTGYSSGTYAINFTATRVR